MEEAQSLESELIDLTDVDLDQVGALPSSLLSLALGRIIRELGDPTEPIASFKSAI